MKLCIRNDLSVTLVDKGNCFKLVNVEVQGDKMVWTEENSEFLVHTLSRSLLGDKHD